VTQLRRKTVLLLAGVAALVLLVLVVGFSLDDTATTAPQTNFVVEEGIHAVGKGRNRPISINTSRVWITHTGGESIETDRLRVAVDGNRSVYGIDIEGGSNVWTDAGPVPDTFATLATGPTIQYHPGERWNVLFYCDPDGHCGGADGPHSEYVPPAVQTIDTTHPENHPLFVLPGRGEFEGALYLSDWYGHEESLCTGGRKHHCVVDDLETDDEIAVSWIASSGSERVPLRNYTVRDGGESEVTHPTFG
jgi:hypothetical protein